MVLGGCWPLKVESPGMQIRQAFGPSVDDLRGVEGQSKINFRNQETTCKTRHRKKKQAWSASDPMADCKIRADCLNRSPKFGGPGVPDFSKII